MLTLTDAATRKLTELFAEQREPVFGLRVSVQPGCCSGYQYGMSLASEAGQGDWIGEFAGIRVLVDPESAPLLEGVHIDYVETLQASGFTISNPHAVRGCGCGRSFDTAESAGDQPAGDDPAGGCGCGGR